MQYLVLSAIALSLLMTSPLCYPKNKLKIDGRLLFDISYAEPLFNEGETALSDISLRQARLGFKTKFKNNLSSKVSLDIDDEASIKDAFIRYHSPWGLSLKLGLFKEPFSLENLMSRGVIPSLERSMPTNTFSPPRSLGFQVAATTLNTSLAIGIFENENDNDGKSSLAATARVTSLIDPKFSFHQHLHIGASATLRNFNQEDETFDIEGDGEISISKTLIELDDIAIDSLYGIGLEAVFQHKSFMMQSEFFFQSIQQLTVIESDIDALPPSNSTELNQHGFYIQLTKTSSNKPRFYDNGIFEQVYNPKQQGVIEWITRYSQLNLSQDIDLIARTYLIGTNFYPNKNLRLLLQGIYTQVENEVLNIDEELPSTGYAGALRIQFSF